MISLPVTKIYLYHKEVIECVLHDYGTFTWRLLRCMCVNTEAIYRMNSVLRCVCEFPVQYYFSLSECFNVSCDTLILSFCLMHTAIEIRHSHLIILSHNIFIEIARLCMFPLLFCSDYGAVECKKCDPGTYTDQTGQTQCSDCPPGMC